MSLDELYRKIEQLERRLDALHMPEVLQTDENGNVTIDQGANDSASLQFESSDVDHGMTGLAATPIYGDIKKYEGASGGLAITGLKDADGAAYGALRAWGVLGEAADTTKTTGGQGVIILRASVKSGTSYTAVGSDGNLVTISNDGTTRFIFDAEGSAHADVEWIAFDEHDDIVLLDKLEETLKADLGLVGQFGGWIAANKAELEGLNIAHFDEKPGHAMINLTRLSMLLVGAVRQMAIRLALLEG